MKHVQGQTIIIEPLDPATEPPVIFWHQNTEKCTTNVVKVRLRKMKKGSVMTHHLERLLRPLEGYWLLEKDEGPLWSLRNACYFVGK